MIEKVYRQIPPRCEACRKCANCTGHGRPGAASPTIVVSMDDGK